MFEDLSLISAERMYTQKARANEFYLRRFLSAVMVKPITTRIITTNMIIRVSVDKSGSSGFGVGEGAAEG